MTRWLSKTPWWLLSAGIHLVFLLGATLVYFEEILAYSSEDAFSVLTRSPLVHPEYDSISTVVDPPHGHGLPSNTSFPVDPSEGLPWSVIDRTFFSGWGPVSTTPPYYPSCLPLGAIDIPRNSPQDRRPSLRTHTRPPLCCLQVGESGVIAGLRWLARHQNPEGSWSARDVGNRCPHGTCSGLGQSDFDTGVTGLALLACLGAGYTQCSKDQLVDPGFPDHPVRLGETIKKGLQWLVRHQDPEGCIGERGSKHLYNHAIAALALSEAYGITNAQPLRDPAQKAIDFLVAAQNPGKGWRYSFRSGDNDTSVTGWAVMALKSAEFSQLSFPPTAYAGALRWLDEATEPKLPRRAGYTAAGTGKVYVPGRNEEWEDHPTMTAIGIMSRIFIQKKKTDPAVVGSSLLLSDLPSWKPGAVDFCYWYYGTLALFQLDGPGGPSWMKWNEAMKAAVVPHQKLAKHGCENGSWDPSEDRWGTEGGRVYATAINCLTLECYYIYANAFGAGK